MPKDATGSYSQSFAAGRKRVAGHCFVSLTWGGAWEGEKRWIFGMLPEVSFLVLHRETATRPVHSSDARTRLLFEIHAGVGGIARKQVAVASIRTLFDVCLAENDQVDL